GPRRWAATKRLAGGGPGAPSGRHEAASLEDRAIAAARRPAPLRLPSARQLAICDFLGGPKTEHESGGEPARVAAGRPAARVDSGRAQPFDRTASFAEDAGPLIDGQPADRVRDGCLDVNRKAAVVPMFDRPAN